MAQQALFAGLDGGAEGQGELEVTFLEGSRAAMCAQDQTSAVKLRKVAPYGGKADI